MEGGGGARLSILYGYGCSVCDTREGVEECLLWERKPLTLAQVEAVVGKKRFAELVGDMVVKSPGKPTLVPEDDKRPAVTNVPRAKDVFAEV